MVSILFVDDDKITQRLVKEILESGGYTVVTAGDPRDALDRLEKEVYDIVITDANMPGGLSGFDLVRTLRKQEKFAKLPIAMLTGKSDMKDISLGLDSGADDYILKPIDPVILIGKVETLIKKIPGNSPSRR